MNELKYTQIFIKWYALFTAIMLIFNVSGVVNIFPEVERLTAFSLLGIIGFTANIGKFLLSLIFYSIPEYTLVNYILWIFRSLSILEIALYLKRLFHPTQN